MKRVSKLFTGCLCILAMAIISCKDNDGGGGSDELKASVNKAVAASVSIEEGAYKSIVKETDKETVNTELDSAGIDKIIAAATDYSGFVKDNEDAPTYSIRAMSVEELGTKVSRELEEKITKFSEDLRNNGRGSFSYSIAPGEITGLQNGIKMTIPSFFISNSAAASNDTMAMTFTEGISSTYFADFKETAPESIFKQSAVNSAQNYNYSIRARDTANSGNSMDFNGYAKINVFTSSWTSFITKQGIAGKISTELKVDINFTEFKEVFEKLQNSENLDEIQLETFLNSKNTKASLVINVCDLKGNIIYNYKSLDQISDIDDYITFFDLSSKILPF